MSGHHVRRHSKSGPEEKTVAFGRYKLGPLLGEGTFGSVRLAEHALTGHKVAVKVLSKRKIRSLRMDEKVKREIRILKLFDHPHITKLYEVIDGWGEIYMILEYVPGGELFDLITTKGPFSEADVRGYFQQIISAVDYCHRNLIVHRDLKPENILLDANLNVKIADFGLSNLMSDGNFLLTSCGSPNYAAPEVISGHPYVGPSVDVWSCGVILYAMLFGRLPFDDSNIHKLFTKIKSGTFYFPKNVDVSSHVKQLIQSMLRVDPLQRATVDDIKYHQWFQASLPKYLSMLLVDPRSLCVVDDDIVDEIEVLFSHAASREEIKRALRRADTNEITVAYHLIKDQRRKRFQSPMISQSKSQESSLEDIEFGVPIPTFALETKDEDGETEGGGVSSEKSGVQFSVAVDFNRIIQEQERKTLDPSQFEHDNASNRDPLDIPPTEQVETATETSSSPSKLIEVENDFSKSEIDDINKCELKKMQDRLLNKKNEKKKWIVGWRSKLELKELVSELCRALKSLDFQWNFDPKSWLFKVCPLNESYTVEHEADSDLDSEDEFHGEDSCVDDSLVCFEIQIFSGVNNNFVLDFQKTFGSPMLFLDQCSSILNAMIL
ncbi:hypothetical protein P9112_012780 [Eukaryota sp. TZLM1-RC]